VLLATVEPGQQVVICDPVYAGLVNRIRLAGGVPRFVSCTPARTGLGSARRVSVPPPARRLVAAHRHPPHGPHPEEASQRLFTRAQVAATPMDGWGRSGSRYLRPVFANVAVST
jgi:aspartate/methionine/tyrosine aminotransferase